VHDDQTDHDRIAERFNAPHSLQATLVRTAARLLPLCADLLGVAPATQNFDEEFNRACRALKV
jgi:hypothetical protein